MDWVEYSRKFKIVASRNGFKSNRIERCLNYAERLYSKNLPVIYDGRHFSLLVGYNTNYLYSVANSPKNFYRTFKIPKKSGGERTISEPLPSLKEIQKWILHEILDQCPASIFAKAYLSNLSIKDNARFHCGQQKVLKVDITNFFGSIKLARVYSFYKSLGYSKSVSSLLANLCCLHKSLPQGAPTSAALSNLLTVRMDKRIAGFILKQGVRFTRYADDLTFSGDFNPGVVLNFLDKVFRSEGFSLNHKKTRLMHKHQRQDVTGVVVNTKMQCPRELRRELRQEIFYISKYGLASHLQKTENSRAHALEHLIGKANFINFVNPNNEEFSRYTKLLKELKKERIA